MTAHVPDPFAFLPFRRGDAKEPDWGVLAKYIKNNLPSNYNSQVQGAVDRLTEYKKVIAATCTNELKQPPNEGFIEQTLKPYIQLVATAQAHLPLHGGVIKSLSFEWRDSLDDGNKHQSNNANVEVFSCIYNVAASYAYTASVEAESGTVESVKNAFKTYQLAAGCYQLAEGFLKRLPSAMLVRDATVESLGVLQKLCLCQAHHCSYLKAEFEMKGKHILLSKIATEGGRLYEDVQKTIAAQSWTRSSVVKDLDAYANNAALVFNARAHLHLAAERMDLGEVGDAIARFNSANAALQRITKFSNQNMNAWLNGIKAACAEAHAKAINANETVYFMRIPKELPVLEGLGKGLGRATPPPTMTKVISNRDCDPFFGIVPAHIAMVASRHFQAMQQLASGASKAVTSYRDKIQSSLNALGVMGAIESLSTESKDQGRVPEPLRSKVAALRTQDGGRAVVEGLVNSVTQTEDIRDACIAKLQEVARVLEEERIQDENYAKGCEKLWRAYRPPSLITPSSQEIQKQILQQNEQLTRLVTEPLALLKATLSESLKELARLDWPMDDLDALMPYTKTKAVREQTKAVMEAVDKLKKLQGRFGQIDDQNAEKLKALNAALQDDSIVHSLSAVDSDQHESILDAAGNDVKDIVACIQSNIASGETLLDSAQEIMGSLAMTRSEDPTTVEIQKICNMLETTLNLYERLRQDVSELGRCASQSLESIEGVLSSAQSFALSRSLEAEDIKATIDNQIKAKTSEMQAKHSADLEIEESRKRQESLKQELSKLEMEQQQTIAQRAQRASETAALQHTLSQQSEDVARSNRMQQLLNRQRDGVTGMQSTPQEFPAPPPYPPPPTSFAAPVPAGAQPSALYANFSAQQSAQHPMVATNATQPQPYYAPPPFPQQMQQQQQQQPQYQYQAQPSAPGGYYSPTMVQPPLPPQHQQQGQGQQYQQLPPFQNPGQQQQQQQQQQGQPPAFMAQLPLPSQYRYS